MKKSVAVIEKENQIEQFVDEICCRYISVWSANFPDRHRNDKIGDEIRNALPRILHDVQFSLKKIDPGSFSISVLQILRDHVSRLHKARKSDGSDLRQNFQFRHNFQVRSKVFNSISRSDHISKKI